MKHYLLAVLVAFAPVFVASNNQPSSTENRRAAQQTVPTSPISVNCNCNYQADDGKNKPHGWQKFVTWPEGIVTWAIILTLGAIIWQAIETRRSVTQSRRSTLVSLRPELVIRGIEVLPVTETSNGENALIPPRHIRVGIANAGGSEARVTDSNLTFRRETEFSEGTRIVPPAFAPYDPMGPSFGSFTLHPGEHTQRTIQLDDNMSFTLMIRDVGNRNSMAVRADWFCLGFLGYQDTLGINRRMGFAFRYNVSENRFTRMDSPEYNYSD